MIPSKYKDTFARDNLPPQSQWPEFLFTLPELQYPDRINCVTEFVDKWVTSGQGGRTAIVGDAKAHSTRDIVARLQ